MEVSTCFDRHTAHHQELQTAFAASALYTVIREKISYILYIVHIIILYLYKEYYCNIVIWIMYNIYEIFYLITVYKPAAANTV